MVYQYYISQDQLAWTMKDTNTLAPKVKPSTKRVKLIRRRQIIKRKVPTPETQTSVRAVQNHFSKEEVQSVKQPEWDEGLCKRKTLYLLSHLFHQTGFGYYTYLIALQILTLLQFGGSLEVCMRVAGTLLFVVGKMNETNQMPIAYLVQWSQSLLTKQNILNTQFLILEGLNYTLPTPYFQNQQEIINRCRTLQGQIQETGSGQED